MVAEASPLLPWPRSPRPRTPTRCHPLNSKPVTRHLQQASLHRYLLQITKLVWFQTLSNSFDISEVNVDPLSPQPPSNIKPEPIALPNIPVSVQYAPPPQPSGLPPNLTTVKSLQVTTQAQTIVQSLNQAHHQQVNTRYICILMPLFYKIFATSFRSFTRRWRSPT